MNCKNSFALKPELQNQLKVQQQHIHERYTHKNSFALKPELQNQKHKISKNSALHIPENNNVELCIKQKRTLQ